MAKLTVQSQEEIKTKEEIQAKRLEIAKELNKEQGLERIRWLRAQLEILNWVLNDDR